MKDLARHLLLELHDCDEQRLNDADLLQHLMVQAAARLRATILEVFCHRFQPHGVTVAVIIAESHLTIHTWPEYAYAAVDVFTCGEAAGFGEIAEFLAHGLRAGSMLTRDFARGPQVPAVAYAAAGAAKGSSGRSEDLP